jgi:hypothetical protein
MITARAITHYEFGVYQKIWRKTCISKDYYDTYWIRFITIGKRAGKYFYFHASVLSHVESLLTLLWKISKVKRTVLR